MLEPAASKVAADVPASCVTWLSPLQVAVLEALESVLGAAAAAAVDGENPCVHTFLALNPNPNPSPNSNPNPSPNLTLAPQP